MMQEKYYSQRQNHEIDMERISISLKAKIVRRISRSQIQVPHKWETREMELY